MIETKKIKLYFDIDGKESMVEVNVKKPSMAIRDKVLIEQELFQETLAGINAKYPITNEMIDKGQALRKESLEKGVEITDEELQVKLTSDLDSKTINEMNKQSERQKDEIYRAECQLNLSVAKHILETKNIPTSFKN
ncbi:MAG: hypothetical protein NTW25_02300, partial [Candidatus Kapabacteria bacterium]|nr:hypothetical protein [Candidatus Kapabacteria bacterium]